MKRLTLCLVGALMLLVSQKTTAQEAMNPLLYSYQAVQFSDQNISHDPVTLIMPGTAFSGGFSSYLDNPASAALFDESFGSFGLAFRNVNERTGFLGNRTSFDDNQTALSNLGFVYSFPTTRGSLVMGAGYSQHTFFNRAMSLSGRNDQTTITDVFKIPGSPYGDIAFNTYAIDSGDEFEDWDESILRVGFDNYGDYLGMNQEAEIVERGFGGEYSAFLATEFMRNLMVGASVGIQSGRHKYKRVFLEVDEPNLYNSDIIETDEGGTDIDNILLSDRIENNYLSLTARVGAIYRMNPNFNIGASYTFPSKLQVNETFDARIVSTFNNGVAFDDEDLTEFSYAVTSPARINLGAAIVNVGGFNASFSAEYVDYSKTRIDFDDELFEDERNENQFIRENYRDVWNLRGGIAIDVTDAFTIRGGYGIRPSRFRNIDFEMQQFTAGLGFSLSPNTRLELGAQYSMWEEARSTIYEYGVYDYSFLPNEPPLISTEAAFASRDVNRLQVMATLQFKFN